MSDEEVRCVRYAEFLNEKMYVLLEWHRAVAPTYSATFADRRHEGPLDRRPAWLVNAVNIGKLGDHALLYPLSVAGPSMVLWIYTTPPPRRRLLGFRSPDSEN